MFSFIEEWYVYATQQLVYHIFMCLVCFFLLISRMTYGIEHSLTIDWLWNEEKTTVIMKMIALCTRDILALSITHSCCWIFNSRLHTFSRLISLYDGKGFEKTKWIFWRKHYNIDDKIQVICTPIIISHYYTITGIFICLFFFLDNFFSYWEMLIVCKHTM